MSNIKFQYTPFIGDKLSISIENGLAKLNIKVVKRTSCKECCFYGKQYYGSPYGCYNFEGNHQEIWINCGKKYRPDNTDVMFKLINDD